MRKEIEQELNTFVAEWEKTPDNNGNRETFLHFKDYLDKKEGVTLDFIARPGVTYSLRAIHADQKDRDLFVMVDVIEDVERWLSVCFYAATITDPEERGDFVPGGLLGDDAVCFDLENKNDVLIQYIKTRLDEACQNGVKQ
jgi:hypothetical protein